MISRDRLLASLLAEPVGLIEAAAGYGKSVLASQYRRVLGVATVYVPLGAPDSDAAVLVTSLRRALRDAHLSDLVAATDTAEPQLLVERLLDGLIDTPERVLIILDDAHHLRSGAAVDIVVRLARGLPASHRLLVTARSFAGVLGAVWRLDPVVRLDGGALAFTAPEAVELLDVSGMVLPERDAQALVESTQGWAMALVLTAATWARQAGSAKWSGHDPVGAAVRTMLDGMAPRGRAAVIALAHVPLLSPELCDAAYGRGTFELIVSSGVPLGRTELGWWEMPGPVIERLMALGPPDLDLVRRAADDYARQGDALEAIRVLLAAGLSEEAAGRLANMPPHRVDALGLAVVRGIVESLAERAITAHPRVLLHLARVAETARDADLRARVLQDALTRIASGTAQELARELDAERARDLMWDERTRGDARALAAAVIEQAHPHEAVARARALDVLGSLGGWFSAAGPIAEAESFLLESARVARGIGERTWAAKALVALGAGFYFALSRFSRSLTVLDEALGELPARDRYRAMVQSFRADTLTEMGRFTEAEAAIADMRQLGEAFREEWILAYAGWNEALLASYQGDAPRTVRALAEARQHPDGWFDQPSGTEFLAQASDYLDRVGEHRRAQEWLASAQARMLGSERLVKVHAAAIAARSGDPAQAADAIAEALSGTAAEPQERWPLVLLNAYAAMRREHPDAARLAAEAFETCLELGHAQGPFIREQPIAEALLPLACAAGSTAAIAARDQRQGVWAIRILGGFEVTRAGRPVTLPGGRPAKAVRILAASGGSIHAETLIEILWPETDLVIGRNRLRNLVSRLRGTIGDLVVRQRETIYLAPSSEIDARHFTAQADAALNARSRDDDHRAAGLADAALALYRGELLPEDRYEDWVVSPRERLALLQLALLDLLAAVAQRNGETDEAARLIERAISAEPYDEQRYLTLAKLFASQNRLGSANAVLRRARSALQSQGYTPSPALADLERSVRPLDNS